MVLCLRVQILLVGDSGVGKSSLLMRFTAGQFEESSVPTIGKDAVPAVGTCGPHRGQGSLSPLTVQVHLLKQNSAVLCRCRFQIEVRNRQEQKT